MSAFVMPDWMGSGEPPPKPAATDIDPNHVEAPVNRFIAGKQEALFTAPDAYYRTTGGVAVEGAPNLFDRLDALRNATLAAAGDHATRVALGPRLEAHLDDVRDGVGRHVARQQDLLARQIISERQTLLKRAAELEHMDEDKLAALAEANASAAHALARIDGEPEGPAIDAARSAIWKTAIDQRLANGDIPQAIGLYDRIKDLLAPQDGLSLGVPLQAARTDHAAKQWIADQAATDGLPLQDRAAADPDLPPDVRLVVRARLDARDSIAESRRVAAVQGLDDRMAETMRALATTSGGYKAGSLARIAGAYEAAGEPDRAAATLRLAAQEAALVPFAQADVSRQQGLIDDLPEGELRDAALAIQRHQAEAFAHDPFAAGTALYAHVGEAVPFADIRGRTRQARQIAQLRGIDVLPVTADELEQSRPGTETMAPSDPNIVLAADPGRKPPPPPLVGGGGRPRLAPADDEQVQPRQIDPFGGRPPAFFRIPIAPVRPAPGPSPGGGPASPGRAPAGTPPGGETGKPVEGAAPSGTPDKKAPPPATTARQGTDPSAVEARLRSLPKPGVAPRDEPQPRPVSSLDAATKRMIDEASYAQMAYSPAFGRRGRLKDWNIEDAAEALRLKVLEPKDVYVDFVVRDGRMLIVNTRSSQALLRAGIPRQDWYMRDMTGHARTERDLTRQLRRNELTNDGIKTVEPRGINEKDPE